jgi:hypothetical protein
MPHLPDTMNAYAAALLSGFNTQSNNTDITSLLASLAAAGAQQPTTTASSLFPFNLAQLSNNTNSQQQQQQQQLNQMLNNTSIFPNQTANVPNMPNLDALLLPLLLNNIQQQQTQNTLDINNALLALASFASTPNAGGGNGGGTASKRAAAPTGENSSKRPRNSVPITMCSDTSSSPRLVNGRRVTLQLDPHKTNTRATCQLCNNSIMATRLSNLTNHVRRHATLKQFQCRRCDYMHNEMAKVCVRRWRVGTCSLARLMGVHLNVHAGALTHATQPQGERRSSHRQPHHRHAVTMGLTHATMFSGHCQRSIRRRCQRHSQVSRARGVDGSL